MKRIAVHASDPRALLEAVEARIGTSAEEAMPLGFVPFCAWLGVTLTPGQRVIGLVAYDGVDPVDLPSAERAIAREVFGDVDRFDPRERDVAVAVCGARAGKTYTLLAMRVLHLSLTVSLASLAPGQVASAPIIAPGKDDATQALQYIQGAIAAKPALARLVVGKPDAAESLEIRRDDGKVVEIVIRAAAARGRTGRGRDLVCAVLDEAAFFLDAAYHVNDEQIYQALSPRILPGGQLIISSTPWAQVGLLHDLFAANHPSPERAGLPARREPRKRTAIAMHATTLRLRDTEQTRAIVAREQARDADNAAREYGAQFMAAGASTFFEPACIEACLDAALVLPVPARPGVEIVAGADMGLTKNSAALAIGHLDPATAVTTLAELVELKPEPGEPLRPGAVATAFVARIVAQGGASVMADAHYRESIVEHATPANLSVQPAPMSPAEEFIAVRARMREGRFRFPNHPRFLRQLREVVAIAGSGGRVTIKLPLWKTGEHGDLVIAFVHMAYQTCGIPVPALPPTREEEIRGAVRAEWEAEAERIDRDARGDDLGFGEDTTWWERG